MASGDVSDRSMRFNPMPNSGAAYRRDAVLAAGGYDPRYRYATEYDLWLRLAERHRVVALDEVLATRLMSGERRGREERAPIAETIGLRLRRSAGAGGSAGPTGSPFRDLLPDADPAQAGSPAASGPGAVSAARYSCSTRSRKRSSENSLRARARAASPSRARSAGSPQDGQAPRPAPPGRRTGRRGPPRRSSPRSRSRRRRPAAARGSSPPAARTTAPPLPREARRHRRPRAAGRRRRGGPAHARPGLPHDAAPSSSGPPRRAAGRRPRPAREHAALRLDRRARILPRPRAAPARAPRTSRLRARARRAALRPPPRAAGSGTRRRRSRSPAGARRGSEIASRSPSLLLRGAEHGRRAADPPPQPPLDRAALQSARAAQQVQPLRRPERRHP